MQRRSGLPPRLWWSLPPRVRRTLSVRTSPGARILDIEAVEELVTAPPAPAPAPGPDVRLEEWGEEALLETYEQAEPESMPIDDAGDVEVIELRKPVRPDYARFAEALRSKPRPEPAPVHEVPVERAKQEPAIGRQHTNGCFGARFDLRKKGLLVDCSQCDRALTRTEAAACRSPFCKANVAKVGFA